VNVHFVHRNFESEHWIGTLDRNIGSEHWIGILDRNIGSERFIGNLNWTLSLYVQCGVFELVTVMLLNIVYWLKTSKVGIV